MQKISFTTDQKRQIIDITDELQKILPQDDGLASIFIGHTSAALSTADLDPGTDLDILDAFEQMVPKLDYRHYHDPKHVPDHILSSVIGTSISIPFQKGKFLLGTWQRIILIELNGPKKRDLYINLIAENA